jgi:hypothetical protein
MNQLKVFLIFLAFELAIGSINTSNRSFDDACWFSSFLVSSKKFNLVLQNCRHKSIKKILVQIPLFLKKKKYFRLNCFEPISFRLNCFELLLLAHNFRLFLQTLPGTTNRQIRCRWQEDNKQKFQQQTWAISNLSSSNHGKH